MKLSVRQSKVAKVCTYIHTYIHIYICMYVCMYIKYVLYARTIATGLEFELGLAFSNAVANLPAMVFKTYKLEEEIKEQTRT